MIKKMISALCAMIFCLGLLPIAAYAVEGGGPTEGTIARVTPLADGDTVYVGGVELAGSTSNPAYATTETSGNVSSGGNESNYNIKWDGSTLTLKNAYINGGVRDSASYITGAGIGVLNMSGNAELAIQLDGSNTVSASTGVHVYANSGAASLTITGSGSLNISGSSSGILVQSNSGDATLTIQNADVEAAGTISAGNGVNVRSNSSSNASLTVNGGSLTASGSLGILYDSSGSDTVPNTTALTISNSALVDARGGGIGAGSTTNLQPVSPSGNGIVFNGDKGTVYGSVTLQENLTIGEDESLTLDDGASLDANGHNVIVDGGTIDDSLKNSLGDSVKYTPTITTTSPLSNGTMGTYYEQTLAADGTTPITWSVSNGDLPAGLSLKGNTISGTPATAGTYTFTVTATNGYGNGDSKELSITISAPASVSVTGVSLNKASLNLYVGGNETLTATVKPSSATNKDVTWSSDNPSVATVNNGVVTAVAPGTATITVTTEDGNKTATCKVTVTHGLLTHVSEKVPTCTAEGNKEYWTCGTCGKYFSDAEGKTEIALEDTVIPATGHSYGEPVWSWSEDGKNCTVTFTCVNDASHVETLAATITSKVKTPATCTETGITEYSASVSFNGNAYTDIKEVADIPATGHHYVEGKCSVCGAIEATATVPDADNSQEGMDNTAASNKALPETSDSTLPLAVVALILGIGAITGIVIALRNMRR